MDTLQIILQGGAHVHQAADYLTLTSRQDGSEVFLGQYNKDESAWKTTGLYSFNKKDWMNFELNGNTPNPITLNSNQEIFVKILTGYDPDSTSRNRFILTGKIECSGDLLASLYVNETEIKSNMFERLFYNCTGLIKAPSLPATTLADECYVSMFEGCTGLTEAPALPATTLAPICYFSMFKGCTGLTEAPALPATTLALMCYESMFEGCTGLTEAPALPATTLADECYLSMFSGCTKLNDVTIYANNILVSNCLTGWLTNVAATGTFHNLGTATYQSGDSGIPSGWTEVHS